MQEAPPQRYRASLLIAPGTQGLAQREGRRQGGVASQWPTSTAATGGGVVEGARSSGWVVLYSITWPGMTWVCASV